MARGDSTTGDVTERRSACEWLVGGGELGELIRSRDWSTTPLGPRDAWPAPLRTAVGLIVASRFPMALLWGPELVLVYNDAFRAMAGAEHPAALGRSRREIWPELWQVDEPTFAAVMGRGETIYVEDELFRLHRHGHSEDAYFTACFSPVRGDGGEIVGTLVTLQETTARLAERGRLEQERERVLRDGEQRYRTLFTNMTEGFALGELICDDAGAPTDFRLLEMNAAFERQSGLDRERALGRSIRDVLPHIEQSWIDTYGSVALGTPPRRFERYSRDLDRHFSVYCFSPVRGRFAVLFTDVTERRRAEDALRLSEERLRAVLEDAAVGIMEVDEEDRFVDVNARFCAMLGYPRDELIGKTIHEITAPEDLELTRQLNARVHAGELRVFNYEKRYLRRDGSRLWVYVTVAVVRDGVGRFLRAIVTADDITERKRVQDALRASEARFRSVFEQAAVGIARVRFSDARWIDVNDFFFRMLGRSRDEMLRTPWPAMTHPEDVEQDLVPFRRMAAGELDTYSVEKRFIHADGHHVWAKLTLSLVRDEQGKPDYEVAIIEDIGDRKRAEDALRAANENLREADRRKDEFLGMLSHELRNPLAPIRNSLYILDHAEPQGQQVRRAKEVANRQIAHLTRLVDDLLDVTRIARGKIELRRGELDVAALARRTAEDHRALMQDRHVEFAVDVPDAPVIVDGDETRLAQILGNLLHNAAKFTPEGGRVTIGVAEEQGRAVIHVRDTGAGIEPEMIETIFDPFTQGKQTLARSEGGLGLGLALVKALVALHGGDVAAYSGGRGQGTDFVVSLPLAEPRAVGTRGAALPAGRARPRRVLVIDDNRDAADSLAQLVSMAGHRPEVAYDAFEGLAKAAEDLPDVVLCDIGLPGMDGYEFARRFRALSASHPVRLVAVSGYAQPEDVARAVEAGFDSHVAKPPDPEMIAGLLG